MEKILIIQLCRMGDLVQTLPLLKRLKEEKPGCEITLMCVRESMEVVQTSPLVDCFFSIPKRFYDETRQRIEDDPALVSSLWDFPALRLHYDLLVNLTHDLGSGILCDRISAGTKYGRVQTDQNEIRALGDWTKYLFAVVKNRAENILNLVDIHVGMGGVSHKPVVDYLPVSHTALEKGNAILKSRGYQGKGPLIALQMGANQFHRAWPVQRFAALARHLTDVHGAEIVLLGSPNEGALGTEFQRYAGFPAINLIGQTRITDLAAILKTCDFLVSNDTGTAHIAAAVGTRVLGLYFSTAYWGETAPYGANNIILQVELPCSPCLYSEKCETIHCKEHLTVEAVQDAAQMMISGKVNQGFNYPQLSVYRSQFLANGTLSYLPLSTVISDSYQTGFINRILWEEALGLEPDKDYITYCLSQMGHLDQFRRKAATCQEEHRYLKEQYHHALRLAQNIILECHQKPLPRHKILSYNNDLMAIQRSIAELNPTLMQAYQIFELMDTDYRPHPQMAQQLVRKYSRLRSISSCSTELLEGLLSFSHE